MKHNKVIVDGKYIPLRTCTVCRGVFPKKDMLRIAKPKEGNVLIDNKQNQGGRGAYICNNPKCIEKAQKIHGLERVLKCAVSNEVYNEVQKTLE